MKEVSKVIKKIAWETFKKTGNIDTFMEFKKIENIENEIKERYVRTLTKRIRRKYEI